MYAYDFVNLVAAAIRRAGSADPAKVTAALEQVSIEGANGDSRGFNERNHEGVVDDDVYFARFHDMTYVPRARRPVIVDASAIPTDTLNQGEIALKRLTFVVLVVAAVLRWRLWRGARTRKASRRPARPRRRRCSPTPTLPGHFPNAEGVTYTEA